MDIAIIVAVVVAWCFVGLRYVAPRYITDAVQEKINEHGGARGVHPGSGYRPRGEITAEQLQQWREKAAGESLLVGLFIGPAYLAISALLRWLMKRAPLTPLEARVRMAALEARAAQRDKEIADLERGNAALQRRLRDAGIEA